MPNKQEVKKIKLTQKVIYKHVMEDFEADRIAIKNRKLPQMWTDNEKMYNNDWWAPGSRPDELTSATNNALFEVIETTLPVVTAKAPKPDVQGQPNAELIEKHLEMIGENNENEAEANEAWKEQKDLIFAHAQGLRRELMKIWYKTKMPILIKQSYREYAIKGTNIIKSYWSKRKKRIVVEIVDIRTLFPYRFADSIEACEDSHISHAYYKPRKWVAKQYNIPLKDIKNDGYLDDDGEFMLYGDEGAEQPAGAVSGAINQISHMLGGKEAKKSEGLTLIVEYYSPGQIQINEEDMEDYTIELYDDKGATIVDDNGKSKTEVKQRPKWRNGRIITVVRGVPGVVVKDVERVYNSLPFFKIANYGRAGDFWGTPEGRNIEEHVRMMNMIMSNINDNARLTGNPQKERVFGSEIKDVDNVPGSIYDSAIPNGIRNLTPPTMPNYIRMFFIDLQNMIDRMTGVTDAFRGISPSGDSGVKVQQLINQGIGRLQPKTLDFTMMSRDLYIHWADIISKFYPGKIIQQNDDKPGISQYSIFNPKNAPKADFDVHVALSAMLPTDTENQFIEAIELAKVGLEVFGMPLISPEQIIELAPTLEDKQRAKEFFAEMQKQVKQQAQGEQSNPGADASIDQLRELGMTDEEAQAVLQAREAGDAQAIQAIMAKYIPGENNANPSQ